VAVDHGPLSGPRPQQPQAQRARSLRRRDHEHVLRAASGAAAGALEALLDDLGPRRQLLDLPGVAGARGLGQAEDQLVAGRDRDRAAGVVGAESVRGHLTIFALRPISVAWAWATSWCGSGCWAASRSPATLRSPRAPGGCGAPRAS